MCRRGRAHTTATVAPARRIAEYHDEVPPYPLPGGRMKTPYAVLLALALPASLAAQQPPAAAQADPITAVFRARTMSLQRNLAQAFDSIPERLFSYKPTPAQLTIGYVAQHLVTDNYLFCNAFGDMT